MSLNDKINILSKLGKFLKKVATNTEVVDNEQVWVEKIHKKIVEAEQQNAWFSKENILLSLKNWAEALTETNLKTWLSAYDLSGVKPKKVALVLAGNIPLVGFHDFISVLLSGHSVLVKLSSNDKVLLPFIADYLQENSNIFQNKISFTEDKLTDYDAVIATGSNNTARYFEYYFAEKPHIIRKNRNSVAILTGEETKEDLYNLGNDIFSYFGLGCRSVSKIFVPENYDFKNFFEAIFDFNPIINHAKYANNYDYNKAVYLMSLFKLQENGFLLLKEDASYSSPIATLFYEYYTDKKGLENRLKTDKDQIQCVVNKHFNPDYIAFGQTQKPALWDYADNIDTLKFLINL